MQNANTAVHVIMIISTPVFQPVQFSFLIRNQTFDMFLAMSKDHACVSVLVPTHAFHHVPFVIVSPTKPVPGIYTPYQVGGG